MVHSDAAQQFKERLRKTPGLSCETVEKGDQVLSDFFDEQCFAGGPAPGRQERDVWRGDQDGLDNAGRSLAGLAVVLFVDSYYLGNPPVLWSREYACWAGIIRSLRQRRPTKAGEYDDTWLIGAVHPT